MRLNLAAAKSKVTGWEKRQTSRPTSLMMTTKFIGVFTLVTSSGRRLARPLEAIQLQYLKLLELARTSSSRPIPIEAASGNVNEECSKSTRTYADTVPFPFERDIKLTFRKVTPARNKTEAKDIERAVKTAFRIGSFGHLSPTGQEVVVRTCENNGWVMPPELARPEAQEELTLLRAVTEFLRADPRHRAEGNL
jgi:hypothetical protein